MRGGKPTAGVREPHIGEGPAIGCWVCWLVWVELHGLLMAWLTGLVGPKKNQCNGPKLGPTLGLDLGPNKNKNKIKNDEVE